MSLRHWVRQPPLPEVAVDVASGPVGIAVARAGVAGAERAPVEAALEVLRVGAASGTLVRAASGEPVHLPTETPPSRFLHSFIMLGIPSVDRCLQHVALDMASARRLKHVPNKQATKRPTDRPTGRPTDQPIHTSLNCARAHTSWDDPPKDAA